MNNSVQLVLGGARSGKSRFAEQLATDSQKEVFYIATATVYDDEMQQRVDRHVDDRPEHWITIEEPLALADVLKRNAKEGRCLLVDCLTLWLTNILMSEENGSCLESYKTELLTALADLPGQVILVSNEVGQGVVPMGELSRRFVDEAGWLHQDIARLAQKVTLVVAGLPLQLK